ncbi:MAG: hypothetical protein NWF05_05280 [Candidatus Bathyarchaeota archaeon]|nr:hypothetical protein [Candidatus Bathyarchaeota archaeon]
MYKGTNHKKAISKIIIAIATVAIILVATTALYYGTLPSTTANSPAPTQTPTATPNPSAQTFTPLPSASPNGNFIQNFAAGKTAEYNIKQYNSTTGSLDLELDVKYTLTEGTFDGDPAWVWDEVTNSTVDNVPYVTINEWKLNKTDLSALHLTVVQIVNDTFSGDFETSNVDNPETAIQRIYVSTYTGIETVTVPAGMFIDCDKAVSTMDTEVTSTWVSANVPFWGIVKQQVTEGNILLYSIELTAFG